MDQKFLENNKVLVINQLSARLPFGVMVAVHYEGVDTLDDFIPSDFTGRLVGIEYPTIIKDIKIYVRLSNDSWRGMYVEPPNTVRPYLRSLSKMTAAEEEEYDRLFPYNAVLNPMQIGKVVEWFYKHHFDFTGLIDMGLAIEAPEGMYIKLKNEKKTEKTPVRQPDEIFPAGTRVMKKSGKKFLSKSTVNTVKGVVAHPYKKDPETGVGVPAYTFVEDGSVVECATCVKSEV